MADGGHAQVVAVDVARAFGRASHAALIKAQEAGIRANLLARPRDYLNGRQRQVVFGGHKSHPHEIGAGDHKAGFSCRQYSSYMSEI